jgi:hypothetical protein
MVIAFEEQVHVFEMQLKGIPPGSSEQRMGRGKAMVAYIRVCVRSRCQVTASRKDAIERMGPWPNSNRSIEDVEAILALVIIPPSIWPFTAMSRNAQLVGSEPNILCEVDTSKSVSDKMPMLALEPSKSTSNPSQMPTTEEQVRLKMGEMSRDQLELALIKLSQSSEPSNRSILIFMKGDDPVPEYTPTTKRVETFVDQVNKFEEELRGIHGYAWGVA